MELDDFIANTIGSVIRGVKTAQADVESLGGFVNPADSNFALGKKTYSPSALIPGQGNAPHFIQFLEFDVAVTVRDTGQSSVGGGIKSFIAVGGSKESATMNESISRIKFSVPVAFPLHKPK